jgi:hypothetical protein
MMHRNRKHIVITCGRYFDEATGTQPPDSEPVVLAVDVSASELGAALLAEFRKSVPANPTS